MAFDFSSLITLGASTVVGVGIAAVGYYVRSSIESVTSAKVSAVMETISAKLDALKEQLAGVSSSIRVADERHISLTANHEKLESRVTRIEQDLYRREPELIRRPGSHD